MLIYFAVGSSIKYIKLLQEEKVENVLMSFAFFKSAVQAKKLYRDWQPKNIILDSGAFSVWTGGDFIDIDKYAYFCQRMIEEFPNSKISCVNLDVLPGKFGRRPTEKERENSAQEGWNNMLYLESKGLKVVPVFHQHESFEWLDKLRNHCDYIGISPANDVSMPEKLNWLNKVFSIIKNTIKTHGFAVTAFDQVINYPFYSVDSSSWTAPSRFGSIPILTDTGVKVFKYKDKNAILKYWDEIKDIGIEKLSGQDWIPRVRLAIKCYLLLNKKVDELWLKRGIKYE